MKSFPLKELLETNFVITTDFICFQDHIEEECEDFGQRNQSIYTPSLKSQAAKTAKQIKIDEKNSKLLLTKIYFIFC